MPSAKTLSCISMYYHGRSRRTDRALDSYAAATQAELPSLYGVKLATHPDFPGCEYFLPNL